MKKFVSIILVLSMTLSLFTSFAEAFATEVSDELGISFDETTGTITDADETLSGSFTIPETIDGALVSNIAVGAFANCKNLTEIIVPDSIKSIGGYAFYNCSDAVIVCSEYSPAIAYAIENDMKFEITNKLTSYDYFVYDSTGYYMAENPSEYITFKLAYKVSEDSDITSKELELFIPVNTKLIEFTIKVNGITATDYEYEGSILTIPVESAEGTVEFSVKPECFTDLLTYARMNFVQENEQKQEIIGIINTSASYITVATDERINSASVLIEGIAPPSSTVEIYLGDTLIGSAISGQTGIYQVNASLPDAKNYNYYTITAKTLNDGVEISASSTFMYEDTLPVLTELVMTHNGQEYNLSNGSGTSPNVTFDSSGFTFTATFENSENIEDVVIVSSKNNQKKYMTATWNEEKQQFVSEGYFEDTDESYVPGEITVEYTKKRVDVPVKDTMDNAEELLDYMDCSVKKCTTTVTENTENSFVAKVNVANEIRDLIGDEINFVVKTFDKEYNDITVDELMTGGRSVYSYFLEKDGDNYVLNIDYTDPEKINMIIHDISGDKQIEYLLDFIDTKTSSGKALAVSEVLGKINSLTGTIADIYDIANDDEDLRDKILSSGMSSEEKQVALEKADELKTDRELFLAATMVISAVTMGTVGAPAMLFGLLFGVVTTSSDFFWQRRMTNILGAGEGAVCNWQTGKYLLYGWFGEFDNNLTYALDFDGNLVISGVGGMEGSPFSGYKKYVNNVEIKEGVTHISRAFDGCSYLTEVKIPSSVTSIGEYAFYGCELITDIDIPDKVKTIGNAAFAKCKGLTSIKIPDSVTSIGAEAFRECSGLTDVKIGNGDVTIGKNAFNLDKSIKTVTIGNGDKVIEEYAFKDCSSLESVTIGNGDVTVNVNAFSGAKNIKSISMGNGNKIIGASVFSSDSALESVELGDGDAIINNGTFSYCDNLKSVVIGDGDVTIGNYAFRNCSNLKTFVMGEGTSSISEYAFTACTALESVKLGDGLTTIARHSFENCKSLTDITIPDSVTSIGYQAFNGCTALTEINIPESVTNFESAFTGCTALLTVTIPYGVASISDNAFDSCKNLKNVTIPDSVTDIGQYAFYNCGLENIQIPDSVTSIGQYAFARCSSLANIDVDDGNNEYSSDNGVLLDKSGKTLLIYPAGKPSALYTTPGEVTSIAGRAFEGNTKLVVVNISESVTNIEGNAFNNCSNLSSVSIAGNMADIGDDAFAGCYKLNDVYYTGTQENWEEINKGTYNSILLSSTIHYCSVIDTKINKFDVEVVDSLAFIEVEAQDVPYAATAYIASYGENGKLCELMPVWIGGGSVEVNMNADGVDKFKAFIWSPSNMESLCDFAECTVK